MFFMSFFWGGGAKEMWYNTIRNAVSIHNSKHVFFSHPQYNSLVPNIKMFFSHSSSDTFYSVKNFCVGSVKIDSNGSRRNYLKCHQQLG
jgi:hypothetical protein